VKPAILNPALDDISIPQDPPSGVRVRDEEGRVSNDEVFHAFAAERIDKKCLRRFVRAYRVPRDVAADLTQAALIALWERRETIPQDRWSAWFFTSMLRGAFTYSRARRRAKKYEPSIALEVFAQPDVPTPEAAIHLRECAEELHRLVGLLRGERRDVVQLYLLDELPMKEVAEQLGIPEETAKHRWRAAQEEMAKAFRRERAKERFLAIVAAFVALLVAIRDRVFGRGSRRVVPLFASASLAFFVASHHAEPASLAADEEPAITSSFEYTFAPQLTAFAEREIERTAPMRPASDDGLDIARMLLAQANAALRDGRTGVARTYVAQYKAAFPRDPDERSARQYVAILAELAAR